MCTSIDWISITRKRMNQNNYAVHPSLHDWENWNDTNPLNGYSLGGKHTTGVMSFSNPSRLDMGFHSIYNGSALKRVEQYNGTSPFDVLSYHSSEKHNFSRLDLAIDFLNCGVCVSDFENCFMSGDADTRIKTAEKIKSLTHTGETLYIGSRKKIKKLVTVYNKASEQGLVGDWTRVEYRIMGKPATESAKIMNDTNGNSDTVAKIANGICNFKTVDVWNEFTDNADGHDIGSISNEKGDRRNWLLDQVAKAIANELTLDIEFWYDMENAIRDAYYDKNGRMPF